MNSRSAKKSGRKTGGNADKNISANTRESVAAGKPPSLDEQTKQLELRKLQLECEAMEVEIDQARVDLSKSKREEQEAAGRSVDTYAFDENVTVSSVRKCLSWLDKYSRNHPGKPFTIFISSNGGYVRSGLRLYDYLVYLRQVKGHQITTVVLGHACSMASILFQAASPGRRLMGESSFLMIHEISAGDYGKTSERKEALAADEMMERKLLEILAGRSRLTLRQIANLWKKKDLWMDAKKSIADGFADGIWNE